MSAQAFPEGAAPKAPRQHTMSDPELSAVLGERRRLVNLGYRLLGSLAEAEDVVQETYLRWSALTAEQRAAIESPSGWLTRVAGRICLDVLGSARARRERYVGEWVPEPLPGPDTDPADRVTLDESVTMAFLVVLDLMTPAERVAFVLHDVFGYPFAEVATIVGRTPAACRQLASSARRRVRSAPPPAADRRPDVVRDFRRAWEAKDIDALVGLLDPDAPVVAHGGGLVSSAVRPIEGAERIARYLVELAARVPRMTVVERTVNGRPGLLALRDGDPVAVAAVDVVGGRVARIWAVRNPEKLRPWSGG
jgi:RNA polymerase sigma factor (sigma-70 family)